MLINIEKAISLIEATIQLHKDNSTLPYIFIVGAGVSMPEIPSSKGIVELCKKEVENRNKDYYDKCIKETDSFLVDHMKYYSTWIEYAFPNRVDRSNFFKKLIKNAKISSANLMLAQILYSKKFANTVFTTNFDDKIKKALDLIGVSDVFVSENSMDNLVINSHSDEIQIVHVHGTYNFYNCTNSENEIKNVASQSGTISSSRVLSSFLSVCSPIIIGYSGWENDVIMSCLKERLSYPTPLKYIWICHLQEDYNSLPEWLKNNENIDFILPDKKEEEYKKNIDFVLPGKIEMKYKNNIDLKLFENKEIEYKKEINSIKLFLNPTNKQDENRLDATKFFSTIISYFRIEPPELFINPYSYYSKMIEKTLPQHEDVLHLRHWASRMQCLGTSESIFEKLVIKMEQYAICKNFEGATDVLQNFTEIQLTPADCKFVCQTLINEFLKAKEFNLFNKSLAFRLETLNFIEKNYSQLIEVNELANSLNNILDMDFKKEKISGFMEIIERVYEISSRDESTLAVHLYSVYVKANIVSDNNEKLLLLKEMVEKSPEKTKERKLLLIKCFALLKLCEMQENKEAIDSYKNAETILSIIGEFVPVHRMALHTKSIVLTHIDDGVIQKEWIIDILSAIKVNELDIGYADIIQLAENVLKLEEKNDRIKDCLDVFINFLEFNKIKNYDNFVDIIDYSRICNVIIRTTKDESVKLEYCNKAFLLLDKLPDDYEKKAIVIAIITLEYCCLALNIVPDSLKIQRLIALKKCTNKLNDKDIKNIYFDLLELSVAMGANYQQYIDSDLGQDVRTYEEIKTKLNIAFNTYSNKNFYLAEEIFHELINCGITTFETIALINLSFMIRRKETVHRYRFWEIIESITTKKPMKSMNIILYCISENEMNDKRFIDAINMIREHPKYLDEIIKCWSDINIVGIEENVLAMKVIDFLRNPETGLEQFYYEFDKKQIV